MQEFTRAHGSHAPSLLDLVFTRSQLEVDDMKCRASIGKSDHSVVTFQLITEGDISYDNSSNKRQFIKGDFVKANMLFMNVNWDVLINNGIEEIWDEFLRHYNSGK